MSKDVSNNISSIPASIFQEQFWYLNQLAPSSAAYNIPLVFVLNKLPDVSLLEKAMNIIIARHEVLRTHFCWQDYKLQQVVTPKQRCNLAVKHKKIRKEHKELQVPEEIVSEINKTFKLDIFPLFRVSIFQYENIIYLTLVFHHIVIDVHSKTIFEKELTETYKQLIESKVPVLLNVTNQYSDYTMFHNKWLTSNEALQLTKAWINDLPPSSSLLNLPHDKQRPKINKLHGKRLYFKFSEKMSAEIDRSVKKLVSTDFVFLLSCYAVFLYALSSQNKLVIGIPLSNRRKKEYKNTFGVFVNTLPISLDFLHLNKFSDVVKSVRKKLLFAHRKQEIPFIKILQNFENRNISHNPFFQVGFTFEPRMKLNLEGLNTRPIEVDRDGSQLDLFLIFWNDGKKLKGFWEYSTDLFKRKSIENFHKQYSNLCVKANQNIDCDISDLVIFKSAELTMRESR